MRLYNTHIICYVEVTKTCSIEMRSLLFSLSLSFYPPPLPLSLSLSLSLLSPSSSRLLVNSQERSWAELPINPEEKKALSKKELEQQQAIWELIYTEHSHLRNLDVIINVSQ